MRNDFKKMQTNTIQKKIKYKLPLIEFLEKSSSKSNILDENKNRPDSEFMEKILLDFGIEGKIKAINNSKIGKMSMYVFLIVAFVLVILYYNRWFIIFNNI